MWRYHDSFFKASFYNDEVSIECNVGPLQLTEDKGILVHEHTMPSVHAHHYALYTKKQTNCGCYAPATNVVIETFNTAAAPSEAALCTFFDEMITVAKQEQLPLSCPACVTEWTPMRYYADTHYTNYRDDTRIKIGFSPAYLHNTAAILLQQAGQQTKLYVQKESCSCLEEAGKLSMDCLTAASEAAFFEQHFNVAILDAPLQQHTFRCQTCMPAPANWSPSAVRIGHFEKYTTFGIMYSTFLSAAVSPTVVYTVEPHIFMLAQQKAGCSCFEDIGQIETAAVLPLDTFIQFLREEFHMHVTALRAEPQTSCTVCEQQALILP